MLPGFIDKYLGANFARNGNRIDLVLQLLPDVYFATGVHYDDALHGDATAVKIFFAVALFILLVAGINYMNLNTARATRVSN